MAETALNTVQTCQLAQNLLEINNSNLYNILNANSLAFIMKTSVLFYFLIFYLAGATNLHASSFLETDNSFAEEYKNLRILLEKVQDKDTALLHKQAIEKEIQHLSQNHLSGADQFNSLSTNEKKLFVKKFQKNRFHCGDVTKVMEERQRILFTPELSIILRDTLSRIP